MQITIKTISKETKCGSSSHGRAFGIQPKWGVRFDLAAQRNSEITAMPNPENLEPHKFKKGQSGNPNGRPKDIPKLDKLLADVLGEEKNGIIAAETILKALLVKATKGDVRAAEVLLDRAYGKAKQFLDHSTLGEKINQIVPPWMKAADAGKSES